jgi:hypothetical protein
VNPNLSRSTVKVEKSEAKVIKGVRSHCIKQSYAAGITISDFLIRVKRNFIVPSLSGSAG